MDYTEPYIYTSATSIFLSIMTITLDIFVIKFYWKRELTIVPILYIFIASLDILTGLGIIHLYIVFLLYEKDSIDGRTLDVNVMISSFFLQISYRCSVFCNLVLAVSRTIMILRPFYQIKINLVKISCLLYAVPWIALYGINLHQFPSDYTTSIAGDGYLIGAGLAHRVTKTFSDEFYIVSTLPDLVAFSIPVVIVIVTCIIQVISLHSSSQFPTSSNQRHVTITILLMSTLFVLCNSPFSFYFTAELVFILSGYLDLWHDSGNYSSYLQSYYLITVLTATVLPILNAALNPVIIITRSSGMRRTFSDSLQRMLRRVRVTLE